MSEPDPPAQRSEAAPLQAGVRTRCFAVRNVTRGTLVASRAVRARSFWSRLLGLLFRPPLAAGEALVIEPCAAIHTLGMRYAIDVLFVDRAGHVVGLCEYVWPNRLYVGARGARSTIELLAGTSAISGTRVGDVLAFDER